MKRVISILLATSIYVCCSCHKSKNEELRDILKEWSGKAVKLPTNATFVSIMDTINVDFDKYKFKIITFTDADGCIGCQLKLKEWIDFNHDIIKMTNGNVLPLKFITPRRRNEALFELKSTGYDYPVCIDIDGEFAKINNFPHENIFKCLLLDEQNQIVLLGDPLSNSKIKDLYIHTICERLGIDTYHNKNSEYRVNLGAFNWRESQATSFAIHNTDDDIWEVDSVYTSCECTIATIDKKIINPHDFAVVNITFKADKPGDFWREVYVDIKGTNQITINIEGNANQ